MLIVIGNYQSSYRLDGVAYPHSAVAKTTIVVRTVGADFHYHILIKPMRTFYRWHDNYKSNKNALPLAQKLPV